MKEVRAKDLYNESNPKLAAERHDDYLGELNKSLNGASNDPSVLTQLESGMGVKFGGNAVAQLESMATNKSLTPDALASLNNALAAQRGAVGDINKEITLTSPLSTSFAAFDLEAPAKLLTPRPTPLRNRIPRKKGVGTSHRVKRILGYTGTGTGGVGNIWPGVTETSQNNFAPGASNPLYLERGPQIAFAADDLVLPYNSYSLSDQVSFEIGRAHVWTPVTFRTLVALLQLENKKRCSQPERCVQHTEL